jgi:hypothetical protein
LNTHLVEDLIDLEVLEEQSHILQTGLGRRDRVELSITLQLLE